MSAGESEAKDLVRDLSAGARARRRVHPLAVVSLIAGLLAMQPVAAVAAVLCGVLARRAIRRSPRTSRGIALASLGIALGVLGLALLGLSAHRMSLLYRQVTPLAEQLLQLLDNNKWYESFDLFEPSRRVRVSANQHQKMMRRLVTGTEGFLGLRWAYRIRHHEEGSGMETAFVVYDARYRAGRARFAFHFVRTAKGWRIQNVQRLP